MKTVSGGQVRSIALGHPLLDDYLEFVAARARPNTLIAVAYDLKVFFSVIVKQPADITTADVLTFIKAQRAPRRRGIAGWRTARQWATAPQRKPPPPTTRPPPRRPDPKTPQGPSGKLDSAHPAKHGVLADVGQAPHDTARADGRSWIHLRVGGDADIGIFGARRHHAVIMTSHPTNRSLCRFHRVLSHQTADPRESLGNRQ